MTSRGRNALLLAIALASGASAQTTPGGAPASADGVDDLSMLEMLPPDAQADVASARKALLADGALSSSSHANRYFSAISELYKQVPTGPVTVCFFGITTGLRHRIADAARAWEFPTSSLRFDFGNAEDMRTCASGSSVDVRIGQQGPGTWSLIGREAEITRSPSKITMNLDSSTSWIGMSDERFRRVVEHEFGHAIGLYHEQQNPRADCVSQLKWDKIVAIFGAPPYNLPEDYLRKNFIANIPSAAEVVASPFDDKSIMLYFLPAAILEGGESSSCWHIENVGISAGDRSAVERAFPLAGPFSMKRRFQAYNELQKATKDPAIPASARGDLIMAVNALYPFANAAQKQTHLEAVQAVMSQR